MALVLLLTLTRVACADVTVLAGEPYGRLGSMSPTGHAAMYFDRICAETPTHLRPCLPGEPGAVIARYNRIGKYDWVAIPLVPFLYSVETPDEIPVFADATKVAALREQYRLKHLLSVAPDDSAAYSNWYELVGSAYDRTLYGFTVSTTPEQDAALMAKFNDSPNQSHFEGAFRNCADFVRETVNFYYPHAIVRNKAADLFMTTPKQLAHGLTVYVSRHPGMTLRTYRIDQVQGTLPRSHKLKGATECLVTCVRYVLPLTAVNPILTGMALTGYLLQGRFGMPVHAGPMPLGDAGDLVVSDRGYWMTESSSGLDDSLIRTHAALQ